MVSSPPGSGVARRLSINTLHAASGRFATLILWIIFMPAILSALGAEQFAIWSLFFALTGYFSALDFGLAQGTLRFVAAARGRDSHEEAGAFAMLALVGYAGLSLIWIALVSVLAVPTMGWLRIPAELVNVAHFAMWLGAAVFLMSGVANVTMAAMQGYGRFDLANLTLLAIAFEQAVGMVVVLQRGWGLRGLMINVAVGGAVGMVVGLLTLWKGVAEFHWAAPARARDGLSEAVRFGLPMQVTNMLAVMNAQMDKLLLTRFVGLSSVTSYELGTRVGAAATSLPQLFLLPVMAEAARMSATGDTVALRALYERGSRYFLTCAALAVAVLLAAAPRLYATWLGAPQVEAAMTLRWLTVAMAMTLATGMATTLSRGVGRTDFEAWFAVVVVTLHLGLSVWLLPRMGLRGALIASVVSHAVGSVVFMLLFARFMRWHPLGVVLRPWLVPTSAVGVGWLVGALVDRVLPAGSGASQWASLATVVGAAGLATLGVAVFTGYFHWNEAMQLLVGRADRSESVGRR